MASKTILEMVGILEEVLERILVMESTVKKLLMRIVEDCELAIYKKKMEDVAPSIMLDELASREQLTYIETDDTSRNVWMFIEHYYDARSHNFDHVVQSITIDQGKNLIQNLISYFSGDTTVLSEKITDFSKLLD